MTSSCSAGVSKSRFHRSTPCFTAKSDCYWPQFHLVVELDGDGNHGTAAQRNRDQRKALKLRAHGLTVVRYTYEQVSYDAAAVAADVLGQIEQRRRLAG